MPLSIIIPVLDEAEAIESLLVQIAPLRIAGHEVIVVDGGSRDETAAVAVLHCDQLLQSPRGRANQMNRGAEIASGDHLWFLHADSKIDESLLVDLPQLISGQCWGRFNVRLSGTHPAFRLIERMMNWRSCLSGIATGDQGIFVERTLFDSVGGFPAIPLMEDIELSKRLKRIRRPACIRYPLQTSSRRWERDGILRTVLLMWHLRLRYFFGTSPEILVRRYQR